MVWDFPGGTVDKNPPANAGDTGSIPGLGRFHNYGSPHALEPVLHNRRSHGNVHRTEEQPLLTATRESRCVARETHHSQEIK